MQRKFLFSIVYFIYIHVDDFFKYMTVSFVLLMYASIESMISSKWIKRSSIQELIIAFNTSSAGLIQAQTLLLNHRVWWDIPIFCFKGSWHYDNGAGWKQVPVIGPLTISQSQQNVSAVLLSKTDKLKFAPSVG